MTIKAEIKINERTLPRGARSADFRQHIQKTRVYFDHSGENILENLAFRRNRPVDLYKMGLDRTTKFRWSIHAGCTMCPCSPGFLCDADVGNGKRDVWVTLSDAPQHNGTEDAAWVANKVLERIAADPTLAGPLGMTKEAE
jgi:hypothetical protein